MRVETYWTSGGHAKDNDEDGVPTYRTWKNVTWSVVSVLVMLVNFRLTIFRHALHEKGLKRNKALVNFSAASNEAIFCPWGFVPHRFLHFTSPFHAYVNTFNMVVFDALECMRDGCPPAESFFRLPVLHAPPGPTELQ